MSERTNLTRLSHKEVTDIKEMYSFLDASRICHIGFNDAHDKPVVLPTSALLAVECFDYWHPGLSVVLK